MTPAPIPDDARPATTSPPPGSQESFLSSVLRWLRELWEGHRLALAGGLATAVVLLMIGPALLRPTDDEVLKGPGSKPVVVARPQASLNLVTRDTPDGPVYRIPLDVFEYNVLGARVRRDQTIQPVVLSRDVDLATTPRYVLLVAVDAGGELYVLSSPGLSRLQKLPDTDHLYALPEPLDLQAARPQVNPPSPGYTGEGASGPWRLRLYLLLTTQPVPREKLLSEAARRVSTGITRPEMLLNAFPEIEGLEATMLVEVR